MFKSIAIAFIIACLIGTQAWSRSASLDLSSRPVSDLEIADGAPAGTVFDLSVTTDVDMSFVGIWEITNNVFYQHDLGWDTMAPPSELVDMNASLGTDSWFTAPGNTSILGAGFDLKSSLGTAWYDFSDEGAVADHQFGRLTVPAGNSAFVHGEIWLGGETRFPFELEIEQSGAFDWRLLDPILPKFYPPGNQHQESKQPINSNPVTPDPIPEVVIIEPEVAPSPPASIGEIDIDLVGLPAEEVEEISTELPLANPLLVDPPAEESISVIEITSPVYIYDAIIDTTELPTLTYYAYDGCNALTALETTELIDDDGIPIHLNFDGSVLTAVMFDTTDAESRSSVPEPSCVALAILSLTCMLYQHRTYRCTI